MLASDDMSEFHRDTIQIRQFDPFEVVNFESVAYIYTHVDDAFYNFCETAGAGLMTGADPVVYGPDAFMIDWFRRNMRSNWTEPLETQAITDSLLHENVKFLEALSLDALARIRADGVFEDLRRQLRVDRSKLRTNIIADTKKYEEAFRRQLFRVLDEYGKRIDDLSSQHRNQIKWSVTGIATSAAIGVMSLLLPPEVLIQILAAGSSVLAGGKTVLDLLSLRRQQRDEKDALMNSPVGLIFDVYRGTSSADR